MVTKVKEIRAPVESGSMSDVVLHFLYMYNKSNVYQSPTSEELFNLNPGKYKKKDNLDKALSRLVKADLVTLDLNFSEERYQITKNGINCILQLAMLRCRKEARKQLNDGRRGAIAKWGLDE